MHKPEIVQENGKHKILYDFEIQMHPLISVRRPDLINESHQKREKQLIVYFAVAADHKVKMEKSKKWNKYLDLARELKNNMEHERDTDTNYKWCAW